MPAPCPVLVFSIELELPLASAGFAKRHTSKQPSSAQFKNWRWSCLSLCVQDLTFDTDPAVPVALGLGWIREVTSFVYTEMPFLFTALHASLSFLPAIHTTRAESFLAMPPIMELPLSLHACVLNSSFGGASIYRCGQVFIICRCSHLSIDAAIDL